MYLVKQSEYTLCDLVPLFPLVFPSDVKRESWGLFLVHHYVVLHLRSCRYPKFYITSFETSYTVYYSIVSTLYSVSSITLQLAPRTIWGLRLLSVLCFLYRPQKLCHLKNKMKKNFLSKHIYLQLWRYRRRNISFTKFYKIKRLHLFKVLKIERYSLDYDNFVWNKLVNN